MGGGAEGQGRGGDRGQGTGDRGQGNRGLEGMVLGSQRRPASFEHQQNRKQSLRRDEEKQHRGKVRKTKSSALLIRRARIPRPDIKRTLNTENNRNPII